MTVLGLHCCLGFSLVEMNRVYSPAALPLLRFLLSMSSRARQPPELQLSSSASAQWLWHRGLVAPQHTESSQIRDGTCVSCLHKQILYHPATRETHTAYGSSLNLIKQHGLKLVHLMYLYWLSWILLYLGYFLPHYFFAL